MEELLHQRNTVMVGLLVYQGLDSGEMARIEITHIHLKEGSIFIPSGRRSNGRTLKLKADQILPFKTYLQETRPHLLVKRNTNTVFLFPVKKYSDMICKLVAKVKKTNPAVIDARQIRVSVLMN